MQQCTKQQHTMHDYYYAPTYEGVNDAAVGDAEMYDAAVNDAAVYDAALTIEKRRVSGINRAAI